jgi:hypothetical protein
MRKILLLILAATATAALPTPSDQARAQGGQIWCDAYRRCVNTTNQAFISCQSLAIQRGWNMTRTDYRGRTAFIYSCLRGRIPR